MECNGRGTRPRRVIPEWHDARLRRPYPLGMGGAHPENRRIPCRAGDSSGADDEIRTRDPHLGKVPQPVPLTCTLFVGLGRFELGNFGPPDALAVIHQSRWFQLARDFDHQTHRIELSDLSYVIRHLLVVTRIVTRSGRVLRGQEHQTDQSSTLGCSMHTKTIGEQS